MMARFLYDVKIYINNCNNIDVTAKNLAYIIRIYCREFVYPRR